MDVCNIKVLYILDYVVPLQYLVMQPNIGTIHVKI